MKLTLERDVRELSRLRQGRLLGSLLDRLAGQTAQVLNVDRAAAQAGLPSRTADAYTTLLEKVFLVYRLDACGLGHWRTRDGDEVDLVVERDDGGVIGFEMKSGSRVGGAEFKGLRKLREATGDNFVGGFAIYLGERSYTHEDRLHVMPLDRLWTTTLPIVDDRFEERTRKLNGEH